MRARYWNCSRFADWVRGTAKPESETSGGWRNWRKNAMEKHPFRYWLVEDAFTGIQDFLSWPKDKIYSVKYYINNRWVSRTHSLTASSKNIPRGEWRDLGNRFLPCLFDELVNFVEVELASHYIAWMDKGSRAKYNPPFWASGWFRWRTWRCPQAGLDSLQWQSKLVYDSSMVPEDHPQFGEPTQQATNAIEVLELYRWWKEVYPKRPDAMDASGWTDLCLKRRESNDPFDIMFEDETEEQRVETSAALARCREIEDAYRAEDETMLIRLIKVREFL